tara:strand:+ start:377 stop:769 length:393 start_codon:yes stop_codon:yes gene_type:complete
MSSINYANCRRCRDTFFHDDGKFQDEKFTCNKCEQWEKDLWEGKKDSVHGFYNRIEKKWIAYADVESLKIGDVISATSFTRGKSDQYSYKGMTITKITKCYLDVRFEFRSQSQRFHKNSLGRIIRAESRR